MPPPPPPWRVYFLRVCVRVCMVWFLVCVCVCVLRVRVCPAIDAMITGAAQHVPMRELAPYIHTYLCLTTCTLAYLHQKQSVHPARPAEVPRPPLHLPLRSVALNPTCQYIWDPENPFRCAWHTAFQRGMGGKKNSIPFFPLYPITSLPPSLPPSPPFVLVFFFTVYPPNRAVCAFWGGGK